MRWAKAVSYTHLDQDKAGGDDLVARLGLDQLQGGADGVGGGVGGAAQQGVGLALSLIHICFAPPRGAGNQKK